MREKRSICFEDYYKFFLTIGIISIVLGLFVNAIQSIESECFSFLKEKWTRELVAVLSILLGLFLAIKASIAGSRKYLRKKMEESKKNFKSDYEELLYKGYDDISKIVNGLKEMSFEKEYNTIKNRNEVIEDFQKKIKDNGIKKNELRRIAMWLEEGLDLCDAAKKNVGSMVTEMSLVVALLAVLISTFSLMGIFPQGIRIFFGFTILIMVVLLSPTFDFEGEIKGEFNKVLQGRKMILQAANREVKKRLMELEEEENEKYGVDPKEPSRSCTQVELLGKKILKIDTEKK